jgi:Ca-activated chloride channel family protein
MFWKIGLAAGLQLMVAMQLCSQVVELKPLNTRRSSIPDTVQPLIRANSNLILVPVHVTSRTGETVSGLDAKLFTVLEDKAPQPIVSFGNDDVPISIGVVLDLSGSMSNKSVIAANALHSFLEIANPEDEAFLLTVSTRPESVSGFTQDFGFLEDHLLGVKDGGATALVDTIYLGLERMRSARNSRKALLIISDGMDNHSRYSIPELMRIAEERDVQIYSIGVETFAITKKPMELTEDRNGQFFLQSLADRTGGLKLTVRDFSDTPSAAAKLGRAMRDQYVIGYSPGPKNETGKWRTIQVKVALPQTRVSSRTGYYVR